MKVMNSSSWRSQRSSFVEQALTYAMFDQKRTVTPEMVLKIKNLEG
jgi:hypothetical protein